MQPYFKKFPLIEYSNSVCRDLTRRVRLSDDLTSRPDLFYPYDIDPGLRSDELSQAFYDDPSYDWLIYLTNGIIDPYYGWYLDDYQFERFIEKKYGLRETAEKKIMFWRVDWSSEAETSVPPSYYLYHLPFALRKYYNPKRNARNEIYEYVRKENDWRVNTNMIVKYDVTYADRRRFSTDEFIDISHSGEAICTATCILANSSALIVQHTIGDTTANSTYSVSITGETSTASATSTNSEVLDYVIPLDEFVYWESVSAYQYEQERNELNKMVHLLDSGVALDVAEDLREKLK
jgi:hypothetical protein